MIENSGYYEGLLKNFVDYPNPHFIQIELDLKWTFPEDPYFANPATINWLRNILCCFAKRNPSVGYC